MIRDLLFAVLLAGCSPALPHIPECDAHDGGIKPPHSLDDVCVCVETLAGGELKLHAVACQ